MKKTIFSLSFIVVICACAFVSSNNWIDEYRLGRIGYQNFVEFIDSTNDYSTIPKEIKSLHPRVITKKNEGVYIKLHGFFVEETGLFVPNKNIDFIPRLDTDPSYIQISERLYWYKIKG